MTVYVGGSRIVKIEYGIETSQQSILRDYYFDKKGVALVVETVYGLLDDQANRLKQPKLESENRYWLSGEEAAKTPADKKKELRRHAKKLLDYYRTHMDSFTPCHKEG
jgi:hypothetical protein